MFQVGENVCYGATGVCQIAARQARQIAGQWMECYILKPVFDKSMTICVPCQSTVLLQKMRPVLTKEEVLALIREIPEGEADYITDPEARRQFYAETLKSGDHRALVRMVRMLYGCKQTRLAQHKNLSGSDANALREAENVLHTEIALVLGIRPDEVADTIRAQLEPASAG